MTEWFSISGYVDIIVQVAFVIIVIMVIIWLLKNLSGILKS